METMFYLKDFRTKKRAVLEEKFEVSYAINEFYLYYPKLITFGVAEVSIYDLETHEKLKANALKRVPNVYFDYSNKDRYSLYNLNEGFGWGAKYHKKDDTSCFIVGFRELVTDNEISYLVSINPHNDQITVYDSINYRHPDTTNWSTIPIDIWHYSKAIGLVYSLGDSAYKIKDLEHRPFKKVKLRIPNPDIESVNSKYTITRGSICLDSSKMHLNFQIFQTNDFSLVKRIDKTIKILSPEMIKEGFMGKKMIFDKYLFVPYKINHITNDKWDYMVYDISQNKLKRLVGISHLDSVFEDDQNSYLYIPNKGIFLSKK